MHAVVRRDSVARELCSDETTSIRLKDNIIISTDPCYVMCACGRRCWYADFHHIPKQMRGHKLFTLRRNTPTPYSPNPRPPPPPPSFPLGRPPHFESIRKYTTRAHHSTKLFFAWTENPSIRLHESAQKYLWQCRYRRRLLVNVIVIQIVPQHNVTTCM